MFELKSLSPEGITAALEKAERYRLLNEPEQAESICLDVLAIDPDNQQALVTLLLALTDQFPNGPAGLCAAGPGRVPQLEGEYEQAYYAGIICERRANARLRGASAGRRERSRTTSTARRWSFTSGPRSSARSGTRTPGSAGTPAPGRSCGTSWSPPPKSAREPIMSE